MPSPGISTIVCFAMMNAQSWCDAPTIAIARALCKGDTCVPSRLAPQEGDTRIAYAHPSGRTRYNVARHADRRAPSDAVHGSVGGNQPADSGVVMAGLDAWVYCRPYHGAAAGGDVYYVSSCATGRITRLLVADVSGHGD